MVSKTLLMVGGLCLTLALVSVAHAQFNLENYYDDYQQREDRRQERWDRWDRQAEQREQQQQDMWNQLNPPRDPLADYYQRRDEDRSNSLNACLGIHSNYAAQQRCLEQIQ